MTVVRSCVFAVVFYGWSSLLSPFYVPLMLLPRRMFWFMAWNWVRSCLFLVEHGLLDSPILYLSHYIIRNKAAYYRLLQDVTREQAWGPWILFVLDGIEETCTWTTDKIKAIRELMDHTAHFVQRRMPKFYSWELVALLFKQPYCRIVNLVEAGVAKRQTASVYLKNLVNLGVLREVKSGRENLFVHPKYIELLTGEENVWVYYADIETESTA